MEVRLGGCRVIVDFGFPAAMAVMLLHMNARFLMMTLGVCMLHEIGHGIAMLAVGAGLREIRLYAAGIQMRTHAVLLSPVKELLVILSGPLINFAAAGAVYLLYGNCALFMLHLVMGSFNLLPYRVLDGGSLLQLLLAPHPLWLRMRGMLCILLSAGGMAFLLYLHVQNPFVYLMLTYLAVSEMRK